ncbi:MAG: hypothetical protein WAT67_09495 [Candidatus Contendobacter sp.]
MASCTLSLTPVNGELRIYDLHLAERLGFSQAFDIRKLIKRYEDKLLNFGILATVAKIHNGAGRPTNEYYLNQKQAIFVCMKSETDKAADVQVEIVHVFDAYLNSSLPPPPPKYPSATSPSLDANDDKNLRRAVWLISRQLNCEKAMSHAVWRNLRQVTGCPAPEPFRVEHLPVLLLELRRLLELAEACREHTRVIEKELIQRGVKGRESVTVLREHLQEIEAHWRKEEQPWRIRLDQWQLEPLERLQQRIPLEPGYNLSDYAEPSLA